MKRRTAFLVFVCISMCLAAPCAAQTSLWNGGAAGDSVNILKPVKARDFNVHDIIHVLVLVAAESATDEKVDLSKEGTNKMSIDQYMTLKRRGLLFDVTSARPDDLGTDLSSSKEFQGDGGTDREDTLRTRLAAEIVDIRPNGNLIIEATSRVIKSREKTIITVTGTVRPQDVAPDNSVFSYNIADLDINYECSGPVTDANRRGWLQRLLDKLWPF